MNDIIINLNNLIDSILIIIGIVMALYWPPYLIRKGWGDAENRTKKLCDICFRDIKRWNEKVKKSNNRK